MLSVAKILKPLRRLGSRKRRNGIKKEEMRKIRTKTPLWQLGIMILTTLVAKRRRRQAIEHWVT